MSDSCRCWSPSGSRPRRPLLPVLALGLAAGLMSCGGGAKPKTAALEPPSLPQTAVTPPTETGAAPDPTATPPPAPTPRPSKPPKKPETLIVLEPAEEAEAPPSLAEAAARARRERRENAQVPMVTITNDNLGEYATGQVTMMEGEAAAGTAAEKDPAQALAHDEDYWRQGVRELRLRLRRAADEAVDLEQQVAGLRLRFYAEDDPYVRDGQVKPAWDRALERQRQVETELKAYRRELEEFLEKGRRAGALPGWLRDGIEIEPPAAEQPAGEEEQPGDLSRHYPSPPESQAPAEPPR